MQNVWRMYWMKCDNKDEGNNWKNPRNNENTLTEHQKQQKGYNKDFSVNYLN